MENESTRRTCIVTRDVLDPSHLVRFVADPDGIVVPDLKRNLPGRGVWVTATKSCVEQAVAKSAFSRSLKSKARADENLPGLVENLLFDAALGALGFARKAGQCITGSGKVEAAIRSGKASAVLHALDGAEDGLRKIRQAVHSAEREGGRKLKIWRIFSSTQMNMAFGATNVIHAALIDGGAARNCVNRVAELSQYREMEPS
jgi:predicted RNA-binding protein YlxR (DUF448 family)